MQYTLAMRTQRHYSKSNLYIFCTPHYAFEMGEGHILKYYPFVRVVINWLNNA